ncbi:hypothetical protein CYMTET_47551 [Cymbomonas tetramitiformis]|uniref:YchJ-like middle NTF2-like domain-containing protein n=1 Tax=Cymbomonas tetramitiformis TaxID=36881 RepID=A0AAE0EWK7_9CHLO|nr:hypothetical protein CYMTET_47551 [Cymbomonas tetramitiformis]
MISLRKFSHVFVPQNRLCTELGQPVCRPRACARSELVVKAAKGFGSKSSGSGKGGSSGKSELWLPESTRRQILEREEQQIMDDRVAKEIEGFNKDFGLTEEDMPNYKPPPEKERCPCGGTEKKLSYAECCLPFHKRQREASEPLDLVRARYSAYVKKEPDFIIATTHPENPDRIGGNLEKEVQSICKFVTFEALEIVHTDYRDQEGFVTFEAAMKGVRGIIGGSLRETSRYVCEDGRWSYREATKLEFLNVEEE